MEFPDGKKIITHEKRLLIFYLISMRARFASRPPQDVVLLMYCHADHRCMRNAPGYTGYS
jgi:hypothetical protein